MASGIGRGRSKQPSANSGPAMLPEVDTQSSSLLAALSNYFSVSGSGSNPFLNIVPTYLEEQEAKRQKTHDQARAEARAESQKINQIETDEFKNYIKATHEKEQNFALSSLFNLNTHTDTNQSDSSKIEVKEDTENTSFDLDGVSTVLNEVADFIDPEFRQKVSEFFSDAKKTSCYGEAELPIAHKKKHILSQIRTNRVVIIEGKTGCGKTTQVPQYVMDDCYARDRNFNIIVTQPRRIAAKSVAERVCRERDWTIGQLVGYQVGLEKNSNENTRLLYVTTGVLLQKLIVEKKIDNYTHVIIDEVHERNDELDLLLMVIRRLLWTNRSPVKVVLMSATFDTRKFREYFTIKFPIGTQTRQISPAIIKIDERCHELLITYLDSEKGLQDFYMDKLESFEDKFDPHEPGVDPDIFGLVPSLLKKFEAVERESKKRKGGVLIFLPGYEHISEMRKCLDASRPHQQEWTILPLHSTITLEEQNKVFERSRVTERKIILATNIAESSITVPDCEYVIDFCLTKNLITDPETNYPTLKLEWAAKSNCEQRAGRTGRTSVGRVFRMVTEKFYHQFLPESSIPELLRIPLENSVLKVKRLEMGPPKELLALCIDPPNLQDIRKAILRLKRIGALTINMDDNTYNEEDGLVTFMGKVISQLPLDVQLGRFVILGHVFDCLDDCIIIAACLSLHNFFLRPFERRLDAFKAKLAWADRTFSDPIAYLQAYKLYQQFVEARFFAPGSQKAALWCKQNFIQYKRLKDVVHLVDELRNRVENAGLVADPRPNTTRDAMEDELILKVVIAGGFYPYYYQKSPLNTEVNIDRDLNQNDPRHTVRLDNLPLDEGVLYSSQISQLMRPVSDNFDMEFENSKVFIKFTGNENPLAEASRLQRTVGATFNSQEDHNTSKSKSSLRDVEVKTEVYLAIKMRQLRYDLVIEKYNRDFVLTHLERLRKIRDEKVDRDCLLRRNVFKVTTMTEEKLPEVCLPSPTQNQIRIFVTEIYSTTHFWAQYLDAKTKACLTELHQAIADISFVGNYSEPKRGELVLAKFRKTPERLVHRAKVIRVDRSKKNYHIFFIDYGTEGVLKFDQVGECMRIDESMPTALYSIPALAFECRLAQHKKAEILDYHNELKTRALNEFRELVNGRKDLWAQVYSVVNKKIALYLYREEDKGVSIADILLNKGWIQRAEEDSLSKTDHVIRLGYMRSGVEDGIEITHSLLSKDKCYEVNPPELVIKTSFSREKVRLRGPFTPIQVMFTGLTRQDTKCIIEVDPDSVNCVCLDPDPTNSNCRMLVASHVSVSNSSGKIVARSTTLMPNIRGFGAFMAMIFSPTVELRCPKENDLYISALCGLGYHTENKSSYDTQNDMEVELEVIVNNRDIKLINAIRMHLNDLLANEERGELYSCGQTIRTKQQKVRSYIVHLLKLKRLSQSSQIRPNDKYKWSLAPEHLLRDLTDKVMYHSYQPIFPVIKFIPVADGKSWRERILNNLQELRKILVELVGMRQFMCEICELQFYTLFELREHARCNRHVSRVKEIFNRDEWLTFQVDKELENPIQAEI